MYRKRSLVPALCLVAGLTCLLATPHASAATITACVANQNGTVRFVAASSNCIPGLESSVQFNTSGPMGTTGSTGATGLMGATGAAGLNGVTGPAGATGATGLIGSTGLAGATGATGLNGVTGSTGAAGSTGTAGATGATGATGPIGPSGATGVAGATGATGSTGRTGATGPAGLDGNTGPTGATGATGAAGNNVGQAYLSNFEIPSSVSSSVYLASVLGQNSPVVYNGTAATLAAEELQIPASCTAGDLRVQETGGAGTNSLQVTVAFNSGSPGSSTTSGLLACFLVATGNASCSNTVDTIAVPAGADAFIYVQPRDAFTTADLANARFLVSWTCN